MFQNFFWLTLDIKLNFSEHIQNISQTISKTMGLLRRFQPILPIYSQFIIYNTIRSQLYYTDVIYDQGYNSSLHSNIEPIQYNACLKTTGEKKGALSEKIYTTNWAENC